MAHSQKAHGQKAAMSQFNQGHWEKKESALNVADGKYTSGEMSNPQHLKASNDALASYAKKHKAKH